MYGPLYVESGDIVCKALQVDPYSQNTRLMILVNGRRRTLQQSLVLEVCRDSIADDPCHFDNPNWSTTTFQGSPEPEGDNPCQI